MMHDVTAELHRVDPGCLLTYRDRPSDDRRDHQEGAAWAAAALANVPGVRRNVDDAVAGYGSLYYFIEPRPHDIKLDR